MNKFAVAGAIVGLIIGATGAVSYGFSTNGSYASVPVDQTKTIQADEIKNIQLDSQMTGVHIYPSTSDVITVHLHGETNRNDILFTAAQQGDTAVIALRHQNGAWIHLFPFEAFTNHMQLDLEIPQKEYARLQAHSQAGSIVMEQITANQFDLESSAGGIEAHDSRGDLTAHSSAGSINLTNVDGKLDLSDSAGSINVQLQAIGHDIRAIDSAGSIRVVSKQKPDALQFNIRTSAGHAEVNLPNVSFTRNSNSDAQGSIGNGGPSVQLQSSAGSVSINNL